MSRLVVADTIISIASQLIIKKTKYIYWKLPMKFFSIKFVWVC